MVMKVIFFADSHVGRAFAYNRSNIGISERAIDLVKQVASIATYAIEKGAGIVAVAGDLFDKSSGINPNVKKLFRENVIKPLVKKDIKLLIIGGNHDSHPMLNYGCDIEDFNIQRSGITVKRKFDAKKYKIDGENIGFVLMPFVTPSEMYRQYINTNGSMDKDISISPQQSTEHAQSIITPVINSIDGCDRKIVLGHYHVIGTRVTNLPVEFPLREMEFDRTMFREDLIDIAVFGHVHVHQSLGDKIIIPGSTERIDFGERGEKKYFIDYDTGTNKWSAIELECRKMTQVNIDLSSDMPDPTGTVISAIHDADIDDALVKIAIKATPSNRKKIDANAIEQHIQKSFHSIIEYVMVDRQNNMTIDLSNVELDPVALLNRFVEMKYVNKSREFRETLLEKTKKFMYEK
jgi:exonuclease SbcD